MMKLHKFIFIFLVGMFTVPNAFSGDKGMVMCTMDAKLCSDGSYVSRTAPDCAFKQCPSEERKYNADNLIQATITGSMETPDPVFERILELEKDGIISMVIIMESFPAMISLKAPQRVIDELEAMPRVRANNR